MTDQITDAQEYAADMRADAAELEEQDVSDVGTDDAAEPENRDMTAARADDAAEPADEDVVDAGADEALTDTKPRRRPRSISISIRSLAIAAVIAILAAAFGTSTWLYIGAQGRLGAQARESADNARAEKIALDYAVQAATMDFKDLQAWKVKLVAGTSPELNNKLSGAAKSMEQILVPLQWTSTAQPLVAKVRSRTGGLIVVDCFVSVQTKTVQAPDALQSTATYSITIDTHNNWLITDVGGIGAVAGPK